MARRRPTRCAGPRPRRSPSASARTAARDGARHRHSARATSSAWPLARLFQATARSSRGSRRSTKARSPASRRPSFASRAAIARPSPAGPKCSPTGSACSVTANPGETFLDRMIALVEGAERQKTPNEIALNILLAGLTIVFLIAVVTLQPFADLLSAAAVAVRADLAAGLPDPDDDRRAALGHRHRGHGPARAAQRAGDVRTGRRGRRRRPYAAARQDRDDHARQPPGQRVHSADGDQRVNAGRCRATGVAAGRDAGRPVDRRARQGEIWPARTGAGAATRHVCRRSRRRRGCRASICTRRARWPWPVAAFPIATTTCGRSARAQPTPSSNG